MALDALNQFVFTRPRPPREAPDIPDAVHRNTEAIALRTIALRARYRERTKGHTALSALHIELVRLERAALQYLPHYNYDARMEFIAERARLARHGGIPARQIESLLDWASDVMMWRELNHTPIEIVDYNEADVMRMLRASVKRYKASPPVMAKPSHTLPQVALAM